MRPYVCLLNPALILKNETNFQSSLVYRHPLSIFKGCLHSKNDKGKRLYFSACIKAGVYVKNWLLIKPYIQISVLQTW